MKRKRAIGIALAVLLLGLGAGLASVVLPGMGVDLGPVSGKTFVFAGRPVVIVGAPNERFVELRISWATQATFADGRGGRFQTTYDGPVVLITCNGTALRRRNALGVEFSGIGRTGPITVRLK